MNRTPDVELVLRDYFADDGLTAPDYVLDVVEARIGRQSQRRSWRLHWRNHMSTPFKLAAGLAAVVLVALVGWQLLPGRQDSVGGPTSPTPTPQPSATAAATAAPSASATFAYPSSRILPPGSHATVSFLPAFTFTLTEPWVLDGDSNEIYGMFPDSPANRAEWAQTGEGANGIFIASKLARPYFACEAWEDNRGATAAEMVAAVAATEALLTTGVVDVEIGGLTGKQFDVRFNPDWTETCPGDPPGLDLEDGRNRVFFLDRPGDIPLVIFAGSKHTVDQEAFLADAMPVLESFQFDLGQ